MNHSVQHLTAFLALALAPLSEPPAQMAVPPSVAGAPTASASVTVAEDPASTRSDPTLENSLTNSGINIAPRYLYQVGDIDMTVRGGFINYPTSAAQLAGSQLSMQMRLTDRLQVMADLGHTTEVGLRGPLFNALDWTIGWDAHYRSDLYFLANSGMGLSAPMFGMVPFPGGSAQGMEIALNTMRPWKNFNLYLTPVVSVMSNRTMAGGDGGLDWNLGRLGLGYSLGYRHILVNPDAVNASLISDEIKHSVGARYGHSDKLFSQVNYFWSTGDTYGIPVQGLLAGIGVRLFGEGPKPVTAASPSVAAATPEPKPMPTPEPTPEASPQPTPAPTLQPSPAPTPSPTPVQPSAPPQFEKPRPSVEALPVLEASPPPAPTQPPVLAPLGDQGSAAGETIALELDVIRASGTQVNFSATGLPAGLAIHPGTGTISGTVSFAALGKYLGAVTMTDTTPGGPRDTTIRTFTWTISEPVGPFASAANALGPFSGSALTGPFAEISAANQDDEQARDALQNPDGGILSLQAASGKLSQDKEAANGAAASVAVIVCCLLLLAMGSKSDDEASVDE